MTEADARTKVLPLPDLSDIFFVIVLLFMLFGRPDVLLSDGSTGWHIVVGNYIIDKHVIPHTDMLSYTFFGKPWLDFEWLADVAMASLVKAGGLNLLSVVTSGLIALLMFLLYQRCRKMGCHFLLATILTLLGGVTSYVHWLARPHLATFFGVYLFTTKLDDFNNGIISGAKLLIFLSFSMLIWVNCHAGFLAGFGILGIYLVCYLIQYLLAGSSEEKIRYAKGVKWLSLSFLTTFVASLCNPYFITLYQWLFKHLSQKTILNLTDEYASPTFHGDIHSISLALLFALFVLGLVITRKKLSFPQLVTALTFAYLSLTSMRHMPLFVIVVVPQIACLFSRTIFSPDQERTSIFQSLNSWLQDRLRAFDNWNTEFTENELCCCLHLLPIFVFAFLVFASLSGGKVFGQTVIHATFDQAHKPTKTLREIETLKLDPKRGFNYDNWGGYLSYQLGIPVFIDDRVPLYGEHFYLQYAAINEVCPGWQDLLMKYRINWVLVPNDSRLVSALQAMSSWKLAANDNASSLYVEQDSKLDSVH